MEKVTIIIPAYNAQNTIKRSVLSACNQTYKNIEILIINDGSQDKTFEICKDLEKKDIRISIRHIPNQGVSAARNVGISEATGKFLTFLDADDYLEPDGIEIMMQYADNTELIIGNYLTVDIANNCRIYRHKQYFKGNTHIGTKEELPELCNSRNFHCVWGKIYRTDIIFNNHLFFDIQRDYGEDIKFNMDYFQYVERFAILHKEVYQYCYLFGKGLGTRFINNEWEIQKELCSLLQYKSKHIYQLSEEGQDKLNHFYYSQGIAVIHRIAHEKEMSIFEKKYNISKVTRSTIFQDILNREVKSGRVSYVDKILLKNGLLYVIIHDFYTKLKY